MADVAQQFSIDDLRSSVGQLHDALSHDGGDAREVCKQGLALLDKCVGLVGAMQENQGETRKSYRALRESQTSTEAHMLLLGDKIDATLQGVEALLRVGLRSLDQSPGRSGTTATKSRLSVIASRDRTAPPVAIPDDPNELVKKGLAQQLLAKMFGPRGGHAETYDAAKAADMLMKGELTRAQHRAWKISGRLPDHIKVS